MKTTTIDFSCLKSLGARDGISVKNGLQLEIKHGKYSAQLGQYGRQSRLCQVTLDGRNPAEIDDYLVVTDCHPHFYRADERAQAVIYLQKPNHNTSKQVVRIRTMTHSGLCLAIGKIEFGAEIVGGGHGESGGNRNRWDDILAVVPLMGSVEIKNHVSAFHIVNNAGTIEVVTAEEYEEAYRPHARAA